MPRFHSRILTLAIITTLLFGAGCRPNPSDLPEPVSTATQETPTLPPARSTPTDPPAPVPTTAAAVGGRPAYEIEISLDTGGYSADVSYRLVYANPSSTPLAELILMVEPNRYPRVFHLGSLLVDGQPVENYTLAELDNRLVIPLAVPLPPGQQQEVKIEYRLEIPPIPEPSDLRRPELFGHTPLQLNLVDWYPHLPIYTDGWLAHPAGYYGEHQVYAAADFRVRLEISDPTWVAAASARPVSTSNGAFEYLLSPGRNFAFSLSPHYIRQEKLVSGVTIASYSLPFAGHGAADVLEYAAQALETYTEWYGPYGHDSLSIVQADFLDGMEFDGLFFLSKGFYNLYDGSPASYLGAITVHETAHQWWYGQAGNDQALEPWLDEAMSTFSEALYYEKHYPPGLDWWKQVRVDYYQPQGPIDLPVSEYRGFIPYRNAVYLRGAQFLLELRDAVGAEAFKSALQNLIRANRYQGMLTTSEFLDQMRSVSAEDLSELIRSYFRNPPL